MVSVTDQRGFTLVEVIVVGVVGTILAGIFITFMRVHNDALNEGVANAKMQRERHYCNSVGWLRKHIAFYE